MVRTLAAAALELALLVGSPAHTSNSPAGGVCRAASLQGPAAYHGPTSLGPMSIAAKPHGAVPIREIWRAIGKPALPPTETLCYRDPSSDVYLWLTRGADDSRLARGISISAFRNCVGRRIYAAHNFARWVTEKGIGLGSTESQVLAAYGRPDHCIDAAADRRAYFPWGNQVTNFGAVLKWLSNGDWVLNYSPPADSLSAASFGIAHARVQWIWLSDNE